MKSEQQRARYFNDPRHPDFDGARRVDLLDKVDLFLFGRRHVRHLAVGAGHGDGVHGLEALAQVGLHRVRVLGLREDRDELVVGQKVEAREAGALGLEVVGQVLLHALELGVALDPLLLELLVVAEGDDLRRRLHLVERLAPLAVDVGEALALLRQMARGEMRRRRRRYEEMQGEM